MGEGGWGYTQSRIFDGFGQSPLPFFSWDNNGLRALSGYLPCLVPSPLSVFHLGQSVSGHVVRAKKRGLDKDQKLRQNEMSQFFLARNFTLSGSRHGGKIGRGGKFELIFEANALVECIRVVNSY